MEMNDFNLTQELSTKIELKEHYLYTCEIREDTDRHLSFKDNSFTLVCRLR